MSTIPADKSSVAVVSFGWISSSCSWFHPRLFGGGAAHPASGVGVGPSPTTTLRKERFLRWLRHGRKNLTENSAPLETGRLGRGGVGGGRHPSGWRWGVARLRWGPSGQGCTDSPTQVGAGMDPLTKLSHQAPPPGRFLTCIILGHTAWASVLSHRGTPPPHTQRCRSPCRDALYAERMAEIEVEKRQDAAVAEAAPPTSVVGVPPEYCTPMHAVLSSALEGRL